MENKIKHLEMIQEIINRMSSNSFMLKGWAVTLVAGIFALSSQDTDKMYFLAVYVPVIVFWFLDSYYLFQERSYRKLYDEIRQKEEKEIDFSLNASGFADSKSKVSILSALFSKTEFWFYIPLAVICTFVVVVTHINIR